MLGPILIARVAGTPFTLNDLRPDSELLHRAGALRSAGRSVSIVDAGSFETLEMLYPQSVQSEAYEWALRQPIETVSALFVTASAHGFALPARLRKCQSAVYERLGERLVAKSDPAAVCFKIDAKKDLAPTLLAARRVRAMRPRTRVFAFGAGFADDLVLGRGLRAFDAVLLGPSFPVAELCEAADRKAWRAIPNLAFYDGVRLTLTRKETYPSNLENVESGVERFLYTDGAKYSKIRVFDVVTVRSGADSSSMGSGDPTERSERLRAIRSLSDAFDSRAFCVRGEDGTAPAGIERDLLASDSRYTYSTTLDPAVTAKTRLGLLSASGCAAVDLPIFTGSQRLLDTHYHLNFTVTQVERLARAARFAGLFTSMHFTFPCSDDDYHTEDETVRIIRRSTPGSTVISHLPSQGTPDGGLLALEFGPFRRRARARARQQTIELEKKVRELNIAVGIDAATALVAGLAGYRGRETAFVEVAGLQLLSGDTTGLAETIEQVNDAARKPVQTGAFRPLSISQNTAAN